MRTQKEFVKILKWKNLGEYHDLCVQSDTILLAENFRNICLKIYKFDPAKFCWASGLAWRATLKEPKVKLDFWTDINMSLIVERGIRGGICNSPYRHGKANNIYMKDYDENKESSYIQY